jgi:hypothetical protein
MNLDDEESLRFFASLRMTKELLNELCFLSLRWERIRARVTSKATAISELCDASLSRVIARSVSDEAIS